MPVKEKKEDRRVLRTKKQLHASLLEMILLKGYESVTIQDIIDHANVGRSTFYSHFFDKQDLLENGFDQLQQFLSEQNESLLRIPHLNVKPRFSFSLAMFQHAKEHYQLYRAFVGKQSGALVQFQIRKILNGLVRNEAHHIVQQEDKKHSISMDIVEQYIVSSFMGLLIWWLDQGMPCSVNEIDNAFHQLTIPGILSIS